MSTSELPRINGLVAPTGAGQKSGTDKATMQRPGGWTSAAPASVIKYSRAGDEAQSWLAWKKHLARRASPLDGTPFDTLGITEVLLWGTAEEEADDELLTAIPRSVSENGSPTNDFDAPLVDIFNRAEASLDEPATLRLLECAYQLPRLAIEMSGSDWWELVARLRQTALDAQSLKVADAPLVYQRLAGELPLALAVMFPEVEMCAELLPHARRALSTGVDELLDGEGTPHCRYLAIHHALVACWTRSRILGASLDEACWSDEAEAQYPDVVCEMLRSARGDGRLVFSCAPIERRVPDRIAGFFAAAVDLSDDKRNRSLLTTFRGRGLQKLRRGGRSRPPSPANHSEWGQVAVLRPSWKRSAPLLGIAYGQPVPRGALALGRDQLFAGDWGFTCLADGRQAIAIGEWEDLCWVSDEEVDYLELQVELTGGLKIQRQICLAREDEFMFIADAVLGSNSQSLRYSMRLPLGDAAANAAAETREVLLTARRSEAMVFPLALPEWRTDRRGGEMTVSGRYVELHQAAESKSLYAALWIDLAPRRHGKPFTWRQLAVAEERQNVARDAAVGYRIQFGKQQWIVYRSLTPARNRTLIGHNLSSEFLIARFGRDGSVKTLIEVE